MPLDQGPVDGRAKQGVDVFVALVPVGLEELQALDVADARHQFDAKQVREPEHRCALRLRVAMNGVGLHIGRIPDQPVENIDSLVYAARNEVAEQRDVHVRHVIVADPAVSSVPDMVFGQQVLLVKIPLRAVGRHLFAGAPEFRQRKLVVRIDDLDDRLVEPLFGDVSQVQPRDLLAAQILDAACGLAGPEITAVAEQSRNEALARVVDLGLEARQRAEQGMQIEPLLGLGENVENADGAHRGRDGLIDQFFVRRVGFRLEVVKDAALLGDLDVVVRRKTRVVFVGQRAELVAQAVDEGARVDRQSDEFAIARQFLVEFVPRHLMLARVVILVALLEVDVARVELAHELADHAQLEIFAMQQPGGPAIRKDALFPFLRDPVERQRGDVIVTEYQVFAAGRAQWLHPRQRDEQRVVLGAGFQRQHVETLEKQRSQIPVRSQQEGKGVIAGVRDVLIAAGQRGVGIVVQGSPHAGDALGIRYLSVLQHVEYVAKLADKRFKLVGVGELVLLKPQLWGVLEITHRLDEDFRDIVERLLQLREDEQHGERVTFGGLERAHFVHVEGARFNDELRALGRRKDFRWRWQAIGQFAHLLDMFQEAGYLTGAWPLRVALQGVPAGLARVAYKKSIEPLHLGGI